MLVKLLLDLLLWLGLIVVAFWSAPALYHSFERLPIYTVPSLIIMASATMGGAIAVMVINEAWIPVLTPLLGWEYESGYREAHFMLAASLCATIVDAVANRLKAQGVEKQAPDYEAPWLQAERERMGWKDKRED